jgi:hypothetical protein
LDSCFLSSLLLLQMRLLMMTAACKA